MNMELGAFTASHFTDITTAMLSDSLLQQNKRHCKTTSKKLQLYKNIVDDNIMIKEKHMND